MAKRSSDPAREDDDRYALYDRLDQLEELLEDMIALEVQSQADIESRIEEINNQIDALDELDDELP